MNVTHTPTPWLDLWGQYIIPASHADRKIGGSTNLKDDREEFAHTICRIERNSNRFSADEASANAAFIVKAVNAHDKLVEALKKATALAEIASDWALDEVWIDGAEHDVLDLADEFKAALAAAGEPV